MSKEYIEIEYEYIIKDPHFYRKHKKDYVVPKLKISSLKVTPIKIKGTYYFENNDKISNEKQDINEDNLNNYIDDRIENNDVEEKDFQSNIRYQNINHED